MDNTVLMNLIDAVAKYGAEASWADNDIIDSLVDMGVTQEDFVQCGLGDFVKEYFDESDLSNKVSSLEGESEVSETGAQNVPPLVRAEVEEYLRKQGRPWADEDYYDEFMNAGDRQHFYNEIVRNNYNMSDVDRWFHLIDVLGVDLSYKTAMQIAGALWEADIETTELNLPEERGDNDNRDFIKLNGSFDEVKQRVLRIWEEQGADAWPLTKIIAKDLDITDCVKLFAELRGERDNVKVLLLDNDGRFFDLTRVGDILLDADEFRALIGQYVALNPEPLRAYVEQEVPFRLSFVHDYEAAPSVCNAIVDSVMNHCDVMFDYDQFDRFLKREYEKCVGIDSDKIDSLLGQISNVRRELEGALEFDPEIVPRLERRLYSLEIELAKAKGFVPLCFVFGDELTLNDDNVSLNIALFPTESLIQRLPNPDDIDFVAFCADYNVLSGAVEITATFDTPVADGALDKKQTLLLQDAEKTEFLVSLEKHCKENWGLSCFDYVNKVRSRFGLEAISYKNSVSSLDDQIREADGVKQGNVVAGGARYLEPEK